MSSCTPPARSRPSRRSLEPIPWPRHSGAIKNIETWAWITPSDCTWMTPMTSSPASATSVVTPCAHSARLVRSGSSAYSAQPSAATSRIKPSRWARANGWIDTSFMRLQPPVEMPWRRRLFRGSAEFLGEADQKSFGSPYVAEPVHVFVLNHFVDELCAVFAEPGERIVDVVNGKHDTQVAQSVDGSLPVVSGHRRSDKSRKLESALAVRRAHHGDLDLLAVESRDTPRPLSVYRRLSFELEPEHAKELDCRRQILNDDAYVVHTECHMPKLQRSPLGLELTRPPKSALRTSTAAFRQSGRRRLHRSSAELTSICGVNPSLGVSAAVGAFHAKRHFRLSPALRSIRAIDARPEPDLGRRKPRKPAHRAGFT